MTWTNMAQDLSNRGESLLPITKVVYDGSAANAQEGANIMQVIGRSSSVFQSTHYTDIVGRWIGGNPSTSTVKQGSFPGSHSSYTGELPDPNSELRKITDLNWGVGNYSIPIPVKPIIPKAKSKMKSKDND